MPQNNGVHTRLLTSAAKRVLPPLGLVQKGRSRTWLGDQGWWLAVVEFQPSSWSRGSHLNVGCMWLWNVKDFLSFDVGHRVAEFQPFETEQQFCPVAQELAELARDKVSEYRERFRNVGQVSDYYIQNPLESFWPCFNAAVAHALAERVKLANLLLSQHVTDQRNDAPWLREARQVARTCAGLTDEPAEFREFISDRIREARKLLGLTRLDSIDFDLQRVVRD